MSENLDLVRSIFAGWERGDYSSADWADPEIEFVIADGPAPGSWTGLDAMPLGLREILNTYEGMGGVADEYREIGADQIIVLAHPVGRAKASGLSIELMQAKGAQLFHLRDGKVTRLVHYWARDRALADLGLKE